MTQTFRVALSLLIVAVPMAAYGAPFDWSSTASKRSASPFRWQSSGSSRKPAQAQRVAQAKQPAAANQPAKTKQPAAAKQPTSSGPIPAGGKCVVDKQCAAGTYCSDGVCKKVRRPINVLYLFYRSGDRRFTEFLGIYWHQTGRKSFRVIFPFYWRFSSPKSRSRVVFPFYWHFEDDKERTSNTVVPPFQYRRAPGERNYRFWPLLFWTDYGKKGGGLTVIPLFHHSRRGSKRLTIIPPLLTFWGTDEKRGYSRGLALGLYYWRRHGRDTANGLFPLFYHSSKPVPGGGASGDDTESFTWVFPLNFFSRSGPRSTTAVLPLFYYSREPDASRVIAPLFYRRTKGKDATTVLFPLMLHRRTHGGRRSRVLSWLFLYERDDDAKVTQWASLVPPYYRRRDADREVDTLFPLVWRWHDKVGRTTTWIVPPFWYHDDPDGDTQVFFPLFWRFKDRKSGYATSVLFPLFYRNSRPDGTSFNLLFPFYYRSKKDGFSAGIFPLLFFGATPGHRHAVLFPAVWHIKNRKASTTVVGPFFYRREYGEGWQAGLAPIFFAGRRGGDTHQVLFPLFWHLRSKSIGYDNWVIGPFVRAKSKAGSWFGLLPLFASGTWHKRSFVTIPPLLFHRSRDPKTDEGVTLAGLYYSFRDKRRAGWSVFPLAHHRATLGKRGEVLGQSSMILPFFYYGRGGGKKLLVTPLGGFRSDAKKGISQGVIGPVVWSRTPESRGFSLVPLVFHWTRPKERSTTTVVLPFGVHHDSPKKKALVWFPLFWRFVEPEQSNLVVFPFYFHQRSKEGENFDVAFPLVWRFTNKKRRAALYGTYFTYEVFDPHDPSQTAVLFPLGYWRRTRKRTQMAALPFIFYRDDKRKKKSLLIVGPYYYRSYRGKAPEDRGYATGVVPFFFARKTEADAYFHIAPILWHWADAKTRTSTTFVGPVFWRRQADHRSFGLAPIFYHGSSPTERSTGLFPLFWNATGVGKWQLFTPIFGLELSVDRKLWYVPPVLHARTYKRSITTAFPLFFYHRHHLEARSSLFVLPSYYGTWSRKSSFHLMFPLLWRYRSIDSSATVAFPFFWDFNSRFSSRTTVVAPLFLRHRNHVKKTSSYFALPTVYVHTRELSSDVIVFPLFWHFGGVRRSSTVGFPLYWDFKRGDKRSRVIFPLFWDFNSKKERTMLVANTYYWSDKVNNRWGINVFPLFSIERKRPGDIKWEVLPGGLFGYERIGRNRFIKLLFFINIKLSPLPAATSTKPAPGTKPTPKAKPKKAALGVSAGSLPLAPGQAGPPAPATL